MLAHVQLTILRLSHWGGDVISPDESLIPDDIAGRFQDGLAFRVFQLRHVMLIAGNRFGYERDLADEIRDEQRSVTPSSRGHLSPRPSQIRT